MMARPNGSESEMGSTPLLSKDAVSPAINSSPKKFSPAYRKF
jgi:hypothetical protein